MINKKAWWTLLVMTFTMHCFAQNGSNAPAQDTNAVNALIAQAKTNFASDPAKAIQYSLQAKQLAEKLKFQKGVAFALKNIGIVNYMQGKDVEALDYYDQSLKIFQAIKNDAGISNLLNNIGAVYWRQGDDVKALDYYLKSLEAGERSGDSLRILTALTNIGAVYCHKAETHEQALDYEGRALSLAEKLNNQDAVGTAELNIGEVYFTQKKDTLALEHFQKAIKAFGNSANSPAAYNSISKVFLKRGAYDIALEYNNKAYAIAKKLDSKLDIVQSLKGLGRAYIKLGDYPAAINCYKQAETIGVNIQAVNDLSDVYQEMAGAFDSSGKFKEANFYETKYADIKDTIYNIATKNKLASMQFASDLKTKQGQINILKKDQTIRESELRRQQLAKNGLIVGLLLAFVLAIYIYRNYRKKAKMNKILDQQNEEIEGLLLNILPAEVAKELQTNGNATPRYYESVSVLFTDFKGFTAIADKLPPEEVVKQLNTCFMAFDNIVEKHHLEKIKTIGDSYMCAGGIPTYHKDHVCDMVKAGIDMLTFIQNYNEDRINKGLAIWDIRVGIHVGPVVAGVVGKKKYAYDIWGSTVNIASRMESNGAPGMINISAATYELVKDKYACDHRGKIYAKNVGDMDMYFVTNEIIDFSKEEDQVIPPSTFDSPLKQTDPVLKA